MIKDKKVPELRFSGFTGEWKEKKLGEVFDFRKGKGISKSDLSSKGTKCILYGQLYTLYNEVIVNVESYTEIKKEKLLLSKYGDILIPSSGETALDMSLSSAILLDDIALGGDINVLRPKKNNVDSKFISYQINSARKLDLARVAEGASVIHLYNSSIRSIRATFPSLLEQKKISSFFYTLDQKLDLQKKRIEELKAYKKGIMQRIFDQEIRFKDENGQDYPDWKQKKLGEISDSIGGTPIEKYVNKKSKYKFISIGNYSTDGKYIDNGQRVELNDVTKDKVLSMDDIAMVLNDKTKTGAIIGSSILIKENNKYIYNQRTQRIVFDKQISFPKFIWFYLNNSNFRIEIFKKSQGGTQIYINYSEVVKIKINLPSLVEQKKIASFLSALDRKVELEEEKLRFYEEFKKGLMQRMFV